MGMGQHRSACGDLGRQRCRTVEDASFGFAVIYTFRPPHLETWTGWWPGFHQYRLSVCVVGFLQQEVACFVARAEVCARLTVLLTLQKGGLCCSSRVLCFVLWSSCARQETWVRSKGRFMLLIGIGVLLEILTL